MENLLLTAPAAGSETQTSELPPHSLCPLLPTSQFTDDFFLGAKKTNANIDFDTEFPTGATNDASPCLGFFAPRGGRRGVGSPKEEEEEEEEDKRQGLEARTRGMGPAVTTTATSPICGPGSSTTTTTTTSSSSSSLRKASSSSLSDWSRHVEEDGIEYFVNRKTRQTTWTDPRLVGVAHGGDCGSNSSNYSTNDGVGLLHARHLSNNSNSDNNSNYPYSTALKTIPPPPPVPPPVVPPTSLGTGLGVGVGVVGATTEAAALKEQARVADKLRRYVESMTDSGRSAGGGGGEYSSRGSNNTNSDRGFGMTATCASPPSVTSADSGYLSSACPSPTPAGTELVPISPAEARLLRLAAERISVIIARETARREQIVVDLFFERERAYFASKGL
eukprot:UC1_evm1s569